LIDLLLERSELPAGSTVLDVGCGIGGTTRHLAKNYGCKVTGVTISGRQVEIAQKLTLEASGTQEEGQKGLGDAFKLGDGSVRFIEFDAEKMGDFFNKEPNVAKFDCVWISEAMSHLPNKALFFRNAALLLNPGGKLVVADWFKSEVLTEEQFKADISPIEGLKLAFSRDCSTDSGYRWHATSTSMQPSRLCSAGTRGWIESICGTIWY
jgi:tocopherol O-methyltransferase